MLFTFFSCDSPDDTVSNSCEDLGMEYDICGNCGGTCIDGDLDSCSDFDLCGECDGNNSGCTGCMIYNESTIELATYDPTAIIPCENTFECCYRGNPIKMLEIETEAMIDLKFLLEDYCIPEDDLVDNCDAYNDTYEYDTENTCLNFTGDNNCFWTASFNIPPNIPIYFINTSNTEISITTIDTEPHRCENTPENLTCQDLPLHQELCIFSECNWINSYTYNPYWDDFLVTVPAVTDDSNLSYLFSTGFSFPSSEKFCATITDGNEEMIKCGFLNILN